MHWRPLTPPPIFTLILMLGLAALSACGGSSEAASNSVPGSATVIRVVDGDTVVFDVGGREEHVRLIGIDTPEATDPHQPPECFGREASARTAELLPPGAPVRLERDIEARDQYDRLLAYVFRQPDGLFVNLALVEDGFAATLSIEPNTAFARAFAGAAAMARAAGRGQWAACGEAARAGSGE